MKDNFLNDLLLNYKKIGLSDDEALLVSITYSLLSSGTKFINPSDLSLLCNFSVNKIDVIYSSLTSKKYITTDILEDGSVITSFDNLKKTLSFYAKKEKIVDDDIYTFMQSFFERLLTPLEYDVIQGWVDKGYSLDTIKAACAISKNAGNKSIRYIDTIIFEETKKEELGVEEYQKRENETIDISKIDWLNK